jgi:hypothetical protein
MDALYHATLARNVPSIEADGLVPQKGPWTSAFHLDAAELVFAVGEDHLGRLPKILVGQMGKAGLVKWSDEYQFAQFKNDLIHHAAIIVLKAVKFDHYPDDAKFGHPSGAEAGDWYSREIIRVDDILKIMVGQELYDWLRPSEMNFTYDWREILRQYSAKPI